MSRHQTQYPRLAVLLSHWFSLRKEDDQGENDDLHKRTDGIVRARAYNLVEQRFE